MREDEMRTKQPNRANETPAARYSRQQVLSVIGEEGQRRIASAKVLLVGCGALGGIQADLLARAGIGTL